MQTTAKLNNARIAPQKLRLIADQVRGMPVGKALDVLKFSPKKAGAVMLKLLESAIANAENNEGADIDELKIAEVYVDEAPVMKRVKPRARGRADRITKRSSHITIAVADE